MDVAHRTHRDGNVPTWDIIDIYYKLNDQEILSGIGTYIVITITDKNKILTS